MIGAATNPCRREVAHNLRCISCTHSMVLQQLNQPLQSGLGQQRQAISSARALHIVQQIQSTRPLFNLGSSWSRREELNNCVPLLLDQMLLQVQPKSTVRLRNVRHLQRYTESNEQGVSDELQHKGTQTGKRGQKSGPRRKNSERTRRQRKEKNVWRLIAHEGSSHEQ